jgi:hypothetical protein
MASESAGTARFSRDGWDARDTRSTSKQSNRNKTIKSTTAITINNADTILQWIPEYRVIVCREHKYAIGSVIQHLRIFHSGKDTEKRAVVAASASYDLDKPKDVPLPSPLQTPFQELGKPTRAFICEEPECERISISRDEMRKHCNRTHDWRSSKEDREHWRSVWVRTSFNSAGLQRYFTVDYTDQEHDERIADDDEEGIERITTGRVESRQTALDETDLSGVFGEWDAAVDRHQETLEVAEADVRPLARLQNSDSQQRYAVYTQGVQ